MLTFPTHLFKPRTIQLRRSGAVITGGESLMGETDTIRTDGGGYWTVQMSGIELMTPDLIRAWRAWEDHLDGGVTKALVPVADVRQAPRPIVAGVATSPGPLLADSADPYFPEAVGFATPWIIAETVGDAGLRSTQLTINVTQGDILKGGEILAIDHATSGRRIYRIMRVVSRPTATSAVVRIRTPLREDVADGTACDFDWPSLVATLLPEIETAPDIEQGRHASVSIAFRESVTYGAGALLIESGGALLLEGV